MMLLITLSVPVVGGSYLGFNSAYDCVALEIYSQQSVFLCCFLNKNFKDKRHCLLLISDPLNFFVF